MDGVLRGAGLAAMGLVACGVALVLAIDVFARNR
jgi:hypothetical protein